MKQELTIYPAAIKDVLLIHRLAHEIWRPVYRDILSEHQISFMLESMYSEEALKAQIAEGISFLLAEYDHIPAGFAAYSAADRTCKIHKLYLQPQTRGKGLGKRLIAHISVLAKSKNAEWLELNVNRNNPALGFYQNLGFEILETVDIPYYDFVLNDYVLRKAL